MAIDDVGHSWLLHNHQPKCFLKPETGKRFEHVASFLEALLIQDMHCINVSLSKKSVIFLLSIVWLHCTAAVMNESDPLNYLAAARPRRYSSRMDVEPCYFRSTLYRLAELVLHGIKSLHRLFSAP